MPPPFGNPSIQHTPAYRQQVPYYPNSRPVNQGVREKYKQKVDTNVFQVSMECLTDSFELATGDPLYCKNCNAIFNMHSQINLVSESQIWICEFCNHDNTVQVEDEEKPKSETVSYILEAAPIKAPIVGLEESKKTDTASSLG
jgi:Sec23/Sec24 zinc finger